MSPPPNDNPSEIKEMLEEEHYVNSEYVASASQSIVQQLTAHKCRQKVSPDGLIIVNVRSWAVRSATITVIALIAAYNLCRCFDLSDPLILYSPLCL